MINKPTVAIDFYSVLASTTQSGFPHPGDCNLVEGIEAKLDHWHKYVNLIVFDPGLRSESYHYLVEGWLKVKLKGPAHTMEVHQKLSDDVILWVSNRGLPAHQFETRLAVVIANQADMMDLVKEGRTHGFTAAPPPLKTKGIDQLNRDVKQLERDVGNLERANKDLATKISLLVKIEETFVPSLRAMDSRITEVARAASGIFRQLAPSESSLCAMTQHGLDLEKQAMALPQRRNNDGAKKAAEE
jgi:hypothetical protein